MSRPEKKIDWDRVDQLLEAGCMGTEIAPIYDMHPDTLYRRVMEEYGMGFTDYAQQRKSKGDSMIREAQFTKAVIAQDNTMLIWLGKNRLAQRESPAEFTISEDAVKPLAAVMSQIASLQEARKSSTSNDNRAPKSE